MTVPLIVGNWKANGLQLECRELARTLASGLSADTPAVAVAPPFTALATVKHAIQGTPLQLAAQNCHFEDSGAFTGEITASMLADLGCEFVIVGHSERRHLFHESDDVIARKLRAALRHHLRPILCIGETLAERETGDAANVIARQLSAALKEVGEGDIEKIDLAYEPVWAIGTGHNATAAQISEIHHEIRARLERAFGKELGGRARILYGGSVKPENAAEILTTPEVDGLLVGGASLKADTFLPIVRCCKAV